MHCAHRLDSHCSVVHSTKKAKIDSQFLTENHLVWGTLTDTGTDFCVSTWLRTVTACLNVVAKRDGAALPRLPSFSPVWCQLACLSISRVKYKKAKHINVTSKYLQVPAKSVLILIQMVLPQGLAMRSTKKARVCFSQFHPKREIYTTRCLRIACYKLYYSSNINIDIPVLAFWSLQLLGPKQ